MSLEPLITRQRTDLQPAYAGCDQGGERGEKGSVVCTRVCTGLCSLKG